MKLKPIEVEWGEGQRPYCPKPEVRSLESLANELIEALEKTQEDMNWMQNERSVLNPCATEYISEALAKVQEYNERSQ